VLLIPVTVVTPEAFDELYKKDTLVATFASHAEEEAYERRDEFLVHLIKKVVHESFGAQFDGTPHVIEDWWPNHTRYLELKAAQCTRPFLESLQRLLADEFRDYRIQFCVYDDPAQGASYIGSMLLYADHIVIESELHRRLGLDRRGSADQNQGEPAPRECN
jgi:hypothetical protein